METYAHSFFTWAIAKHGVKAGRAAGIAGAVGAALPDVPSIVGAVYYWNQRNSMGREELLDKIYFSGPFGGTGSALHSLVPVAGFLVLYGILRLGRVDRRRIILWFLIGWAGHTVADFLTHVNDTRPLFWPLSGWEWSSPVSYYDPRYYGIWFMVAEHVLIIITMLGLLLGRLRDRRLRRGKPSGPPA